jgi:copper chaperone
MNIASDEKTANSASAGTTLTLRVDGMTCGGCARSVTSALQPLVGGAAIEVRLDANEVRIGPFADAVSMPDVAVLGDAIDGAGFDFGGVVSA